MLSYFVCSGCLGSFSKIYVYKNRLFCKACAVNRGMKIIEEGVNKGVN